MTAKFPGAWLSSGICDCWQQGIDGSGTEGEESSWRRHAAGLFGYKKNNQAGGR